MDITSVVSTVHDINIPIHRKEWDIRTYILTKSPTYSHPEWQKQHFFHSASQELTPKESRYFIVWLPPFFSPKWEKKKSAQILMSFKPTLVFSWGCMLSIVAAIITVSFLFTNVFSTFYTNRIPKLTWRSLFMLIVEVSEDWHRSHYTVKMKQYMNHISLNHKYYLNSKCRSILHKVLTMLFSFLHQKRAHGIQLLKCYPAQHHSFI